METITIIVTSVEDKEQIENALGIHKDYFDVRVIDNLFTRKIAHIGISTMPILDITGRGLLHSQIVIDEAEHILKVEAGKEVDNFNIENEILHTFEQRPQLKYIEPHIPELKEHNIPKDSRKERRAKERNIKKYGKFGKLR